MSQIANIYDRLASQAVLYDGVTPTVYWLETTPNSIESAQLPARIITPISSRQREDFGFIALGTGARVIWTLQDVLLVRPAAQMRGPLDVLRPLVTYCGAFATAMRSFREPGQASAGSRTTLDRVSTDVVTYEWPSGSGQYYWGVLATLTISEYLT